MAEAGQWSYTDDAVRLGSWKRFTDIRVKSDHLCCHGEKYDICFDDTICGVVMYDDSTDYRYRCGSCIDTALASCHFWHNKMVIDL